MLYPLSYEGGMGWKRGWKLLVGLSACLWVRVIGGVGRVSVRLGAISAVLAAEPMFVVPAGCRAAAWLAGLLEECWVDGCLGGEDGFGLGVSVCLPGEHAEGVLFEPVVVEPLAGVVVVDVSVGGFC